MPRSRCAAFATFCAVPFVLAGIGCSQRASSIPSSHEESASSEAALGSPTTLIDEGFSAGTGGFTYGDDAFRATTWPAYANGQRVTSGGQPGAALQVTLGGIDPFFIIGMSGAWSQTFGLNHPSSVTLSFQYNLTQSPNYESNEVSQVLASVDGMLRGTAPNDFIAQVAGNGDGGSSITTGWRTATLDLGVLGVGLHTMRIGGFNNQKNAANESTTILFDNVRVVATPTAPPAQLACDTVECCPLGTTPVVLSEQADTHSNSTANRCIVTLGGSDTIFSSGSGSVVLAGSGDDTIMGGSGGQIRGGSGRDTINGFTSAVVLGGDDDDTINAANGDNFVYPGAGIDDVACGTGSDTVVIYDLCETGFGERLDGGTGVNTLVTPVPLSELQALGVIVSNFQNIVVQKNSCKSDCTAKPDCNNRGICAEGATAGQMTCLCDPGNPGPNCVPCRTELDSDEDGTPDCTDLCPYDGLKRAPGQCGCGVPDRHSDSDQVADCIDPCPLDGNNVAPGECGCVGRPGLKPAGAACTDPACPQSGTTCNGAGVCGDRNACNPDPTAGVCRFAVREGIAYWICADGATGGRSRDAAAQVCSAKGLTLTRIDSFEQNRFLHRQLTKPLWLGANSLSAPNVWRWAAPGSNDGDVFWSGGANGAPVDGRFSYWKPGAPGAARCALMQSSDGKWSDADCSQTIGYVCQFEQPPRQRPPGPPPGSIPQPPPAATPCVPESASGLPATQEELLEQIALADAGIFQGAAANPPPLTSRCYAAGAESGDNIGSSNDPASGCQFVNQTTQSCFRDEECAPLGPGFVCRQVEETPDCVPPDGGSGPPGPDTCKGHAVCGVLQCPPEDPIVCDQVEICGPEFDAGLDPGTNLAPRPFDAAALFSGGPPDAGQAGAYVDPVFGVGRAHSWCKLNQQDPSRVKPATQPSQNRGGSSGRGTQISFSFDPDLTFEVHADPLPFGESELTAKAAAQLSASVHLDGFLGQDYSAPIIVAQAGITSSRCGAHTDETTLEVFGLDFLQQPVPSINTDDPSSPAFARANECKTALANFKLAGDRLKKSFRDAQQLLLQYHAAKDAGARLPSDLCQQIGIPDAAVPGFPGNNLCQPNETPEATINRFIDYYQHPVTGQVANMRQAASDLAAASSALNAEIANVNLVFSGFDEQESRTVLNVPFAIGPVPMVLQIDVFAGYGILGAFGLERDTTTELDQTVDSDRRVAHATVGVEPHASAGLSAFVGAGFDFGALSATVGLEGMVTLARINVPIVTGAGADLVSERDQRPLPGDVLPPVAQGLDAFLFGAPKSYKFLVSYDFGASVGLSDVLSGELNGRVRVKFAFFRRTWRKRIAKFNGLPAETFELVSAESSRYPGGGGPTTATPTAEGRADMGRSEPQLPFLLLGSLPPVSPLPPDAGTRPLNRGQVEKFFYDDLCCSKQGEECAEAGAPMCCQGLKCDNGVCKPNCSQTGEPCGGSGPGDPQCCTGFSCGVIDGGLGTCSAIP